MVSAWWLVAAFMRAARSLPSVMTLSGVRSTRVTPRTSPQTGHEALVNLAGPGERLPTKI